MELIDLSLGWVFVVSWVFAKDDFFKTSDSLSAPFVDLSVPVIVGEDEPLVVSVVLLVDFVFGTGLEASVTTMVPVNIESFDTAKSELGTWSTWQTVAVASEVAFVVTSVVAFDGVDGAVYFVVES